MSVVTSITSVLPPPEFLRMPSAGVDVSDTSLKYTVFTPNPNGHGLLLAAYGDIPIEEGTLARGDVKDMKKLTAALAEVKKRTKCEYVRLSLPEERAYLFETHIKKGTQYDEIRGLLEFRLEENVPVSPRDAYFDYDIYPLAGSTSMIGVSVTAYTCDTINGYYEACKQAKVTPLSFEVEAQAIVRSILPKNPKGVQMIVDCGKMRTGIGIVFDGVLMYTSTIDIGGKHLSAALRATLGDKKESELTEYKNTKGLIRDESMPLIHEALLPVISGIKDEIAKRIQYWNEHDFLNQDRFISEIKLCGGSANVHGLPEYLTETLSIETKRADVWQNAFESKEIVPPIDRAHAYGYATAIGLGLGSFM